MKKRFLLFGLIFAFLAFSSRAQIIEYYSQDFEASTPTTFVVSGSAASNQTTIVSGGARSMKLLHTQSTEVYMETDTIDFSDRATLNYFTLEFEHIAYVDALNCTPRTEVCVVEVKRPDQSSWTRLNSTHYNMREGGSTEFASLASFSKQSYVDWSSAIDNSMWKHERFDLEQVFQGVAITDRKLVIRFTLKARNRATAAEAWYIDDIHVRASDMQIVTPGITMLSFPDYLKYPSSRGAKVVGDVTTTVPQGINGDSVYVVYRVGNSSTEHRSYMHRVAGSERFEGRIPFYGYDTLMHYHIIAKDSTSNNNTVTFPRNANQWLTYKCVRGRTNSAQPTGNRTDNSAFPFPNVGDNRSEFIYDSATMASLGYGPGYINTFRFIVTTSPRLSSRPRLQFRMANMSGDYVRSSTMDAYTSTAMQIVYDSVFAIEQMAPGSYKTVTLQDTFFYAGADLVVQVFYDGESSNPASVPIKHIPIAANKYSLYLDGHDIINGYHAFDDPNFDIGIPTTTRPWIQFFETQNVPLIYDCGVSAMAYPSYDVPCNIGTDSVVVWLKNFGVSPMHAVRISYRVDNRAAVTYDWTGTLNGGDSVRVMLNPSETFTVGYHTIRAWVDDTITVIGTDTIRVRDHEPYNDTSFTPFGACDGPYSGVRTVGTGSSANFSSLENCLYVLSRCGIDDTLTIKLPAGVYDITKFPYIPGTSASHYVTFEPATPTSQVTFRRSRRGVATTEPMLVDLTEARGIHFKNITFANGRFTDNRCNVLAQLGENSNHCQFINCAFLDSNAITASAQALIHTGEADSVSIMNCTLYGGVTGVDVTGISPTDRARHNTIRFNNFANQANTAISIVNQSDVWVDSNYINDVQTNASYIILGQYVYDGSRITRNRVFSSKGSSCIGVSDMHGDAETYCIIANNMLVSLDDGTTNMLTTPLNIIKGSYIKAVFNSVRMNAPSRVNVAAATLGGGVISNCYFQNNVIATFDTSNYAFSFIPTSGNESTLHVDHNCYYSISGVLNKLSGTNYNTLNSWRSAVPGDLGSVVGNPNYTNGSVCRVDLRSFNALLRNVGTPVPEVTIDLFGSTRNATAPSLGAYEVTALSVDFTPVEFVTPMEDYCGAPSSIPVEVAIRNTGNGTYTYSSSSPITVYYSIDNGPVQSFAVNRNCGPGDTIHFLSTRTMSLPSGSNNSDRTYSIRWWVKCSLDPDDLNDTSVYTVISRYAAPAPTTINLNVSYNTPAVITPTAGINTWPVNYYTGNNARQQRSGISWYYSMDDPEPFYYGPTLTTDPIFADTTFYISQKRNLPLVKITEVQVNRTATGATNPMPSWMNTGTNLAIELTNIGDYPANLEGDSIIIIKSNAAGKIWELPNVTIQPGENLVLQYKTMTTPSDSTRTIFAPSTAIISVSYTDNFAVVYRDGHGVADAVPFNSVISASSTQTLKWSTQGVPASVWQGNAINLSQGASTATPPVNTPTAGARRLTWPTNSATASPSATAPMWQVATATNLMQIGTTETNLIRYFDNGCEGMRAPVNIHVPNVPNTDLAVDEPIVDTGCNLTSAEPVTVVVHNYGAQTVSNVTVKYSLDGGATVACSDLLPQSLGPRSTYTHTFSNTLNMHRPVDTTFHVKVWVDAVSTDALHANDTSDGTFFAAYTPETPIVTSPILVSYDSTVTLTAGGLPTNVRAAWYDAAHNPIDTTMGSYQTPNIYHLDTFYVKAIALKDVPNTHIGTLASVMNNNYPSPYNPKTRYVKEQYLVTAEQLQAAGHGAGTISSLSFYLESLGANVTNFTYSYYTIKMGNTTNSVFANGNYLTGLTQVYNATNLAFNANNIGWVEHKFDTPYVWDGTSNIVIEVTRALSTAGISAGANTRYTAQANTVITKQNATTDQASQTSGNKGNNRPDMLFGFLEPVGCESAEATICIDVTNVPTVDATIEWPAELDTMTIASCSSTSLDVVLKNLGYNDITNYTLRYKIDNNSWQQTTGNANNLRLGYNITVPLMSTPLTPGRHNITAVINVAGDSVNSNDTISRTLNVRFCAGSYIVGNCAGSDYATLATAIDTLHNAGVAGPVTFELCEQTFNGPFVLGNVPGADFNNMITFTTISGATDMAKIMATTTNSVNYVFALNGANYVTFDSIYFYANYTTGSGNNIYANVVNVDGSSNIAFRNCTLRSKKTTASSTNANVLVLGDENYYITVDNCVIDSGYYGIRSMATTHSNNITVSHSDILNFWYQGIYLRNTDTIKVMSDSISSGVTVAGKPLTGIYISDASNVAVQKNFVFLIDDKTGGKRGIQLNHCRGTNIDRVTVYNNMISVSGSAVASLTSSGIWIDSLSKYVNVAFNTANLYAGANQAATRVFSAQNSSNIHSLNNIFKNESQGYAAYIAIDTCLASSNFNVYYSNAVPNPNTGARKFVKWGTPDCPNLDSLRIVNAKDINSYEEFPYFINSPRDLRLALAQYAGLAQYNPDVTTDIFDSIRPQIPAPTIGAHEYGRLTHNTTIAQIIDPQMPLTTTGSNVTPLNIETDSIMVRVRFYNNGNGPENNVTWYAYLADVYPEVRSVTRTVNGGRFPIRTFIEDSVKLASPLGVVDTQHVVVMLENAPNVVDDDPLDNVDTADFFIFPAFNLQVTAVALDSTVDPLHCRMYHVPLKYTLRNAGYKDFPGDAQFNLGYDYYCQSPASQSFPNIPGSNSNEIVTLGTALPVATTRDISLSLANQPNLYPTGYIGDITVKLRGFCNYIYDVKPANDTTNYISITSNHTPEMPVGHDTLVNYGAYGNLWSTQSASRVVRWHRDTTSGEFFYNGNNNYNRSTHWSATPQYFHDSLYYLSCLSSRNCTSYYSSIAVGINPPLDYDVSISEVVSPRGSGRVYNEKDTVKLRVANYGRYPIRDIPIAFKFMNANGRTTYLEVHDTLREEIPGRVGDNVHSAVFVFDTSLLQINSPINSTTFTLNAWVYHPDDQERGNDTLRSVHMFASLPENIYDIIEHDAPATADGFDITRVSFNTLDNVMPDMIGYTNLFLGNYNANQAEVPCLRLRHGTTDTLTIEVANNLNEMDSSTAASLVVAIDYNRDGLYEMSEYLTRDTMNYVLGAKVHSRREYKMPYTIPDSAHYGYMRMMVYVNNDSTYYATGTYNPTGYNGQIQQYLLYVAEDCMMDSFDVAVTRVVYPRNHIVGSRQYPVSFMLANTGTQPLTAADISYQFYTDNGVARSGVINWTGELPAGHSEVVTIDSVRFGEGTTDFHCQVKLPEDTEYTRPALNYRYHRYYVVEPRFIDSFDQFVNKWYAPAGYNNFTKNFFERGTPAKSRIVSAYSVPNAYVTSCTQPVMTGTHGNRSVIYSPMINIRTIKPDTVSFVLSKNMGTGSYLRLEYLNYQGDWVAVDDVGARWTLDDNPSWYDSIQGWTNNTPNGSYVRLTMPTVPISGEFGQDFQLRFVYTTPPMASSSASFGDGVAIDNFNLGRAQRAIDVGITEITYPTDPQFGQTVYPRAIIHNYGSDSIHDFILGYLPFGTYLSHETVCTQTIPAGGDLEFEFPDPFIITDQFPDTFQICAYTRALGDIYTDNDSVCSDFALSPLANDLYMYSIASPLNSCVAGDSLDFTVRLRNFGQNEIEDCDVYYLYNEEDTVHEHICFADYLGRNLGSTEFFNYTFQKRQRATFGIMNLTTWCKYSADVYPYNDTLTKRIEGIANLIDMQASGAIVDTRSFGDYSIGIVLDNVGSYGCNNFTVGYWYDNQDSTRFEETYSAPTPIPAGGHTVHMFSQTIPHRVAPYNYATVYLVVPGDTNQTNDTSSIIQPYTTDISIDRIEVEENNTDSCRVRALLTNHGNIPYFYSYKIDATINGQTVGGQFGPNVYSIGPGESRYLPFIKAGNEKKILKSPTRTYTGSATISQISEDSDPTNNQTTIIRVVNYFENIPLADDPDFRLEQNYPNPYDGKTNIEFMLPYSGHVHFFVNDVIGRQVYQENASYDAGRHVVTFDRGDLPAGVYYYGIEFNGERRMSKMIVR